ncbi:periplasmic binding protein-like II [Anaeromyces robustus]|uniref:Periplasmic binding protein-like II n=1 Tax=Anaeromyces robustus TaxID=1754192 RepID=A0A1Y1X3Y6_9FUNG|nr:periplasmic binding protein-like II [Anaeromyces robustus]|eukprot:ORX80086.1 periplasmic binding protein-like II [Anaeromyces robustus]
MIWQNILLFIFIQINICYAIDIKAVAFSLNGGGDLYLPLIDRFNKFSQENNLNINLTLDLYTETNSTAIVTDYEAMLDSLISSPHNTYDLYFYDNIYSIKFAPYLINLKEWLPKEHIDMYAPGIGSQSCVSKDKWVGLPITIDFTVLYSNPTYLQKYNKSIPKTWKDLLETSKEILDEENKLGNSKLMGYNGLFNSLEIGTCSIYEFIYSFRESVDSPFPSFPSIEAIDALKMMKKLNEEIGSDSHFQFNDDYTAEKMQSGDFIFIKYWYFPNMPFNVTALPGGKVGISGSSIGGFNIGVSNYVDEDRKKAAVIALEYITSKDMQKRIVMENKLFSGIPSLYDEPEVCNVIDCEFFKSIQLIARPTSKSKNYSSYSEKFRKYIYEYLYGDKSPEYVLKKINDISKFYYISTNTENTNIGVIMVIVVGLLSIIMLFSLKFLSIKHMRPYFRFLTDDFWVLTVFGSLLIMYASFTGLGKVSILKCELRTLLLSVGFTMSLIPIFYRLILNFPEQNMISHWVSNNKYLFLIIFIFTDILINTLAFNSPYTIEDKLVAEGENFQVCKMTTYGKLLNYLLLISKFIITLCMLFFIFIEWNIEESRLDIRYLSIAIYMDVISIVVLIIFNWIDVNDYIIATIIPNGIYIFFAVTNYVFFFNYRIVLAFMKKDDDDDLFYKTFSKGTSNYGSTSYLNNSKSNNNKDISNNKNQMSDKLLSYHYRTNINNSSSSSLLQSNYSEDSLN